jgi:hypothetical protein
VADAAGPAGVGAAHGPAPSEPLSDPQPGQLPPTAPPTPTPTPTSNVSSGYGGSWVGQRHATLTVGMSSTVLVALTYDPMVGTGAVCAPDSTGPGVARADDPAFSPD